MRMQVRANPNGTNPVPESNRIVQPQPTVCSTLRTPSIIMSDEIDFFDDDSALLPVLTTEPPAPLTTPPGVTLDESDEELRELFTETTTRPRNRSNAPPKTRSSTFAKHSATAASSSSSNSLNAPSAKVSRPENGVSSDGEYFGDENRAPTEIDPALLDDDSNFYCSPSLYQGDDKPEKQEIDTKQLRQLLELNKKSSDARQEMETPVEMKSLLMKHQKQALYWMVNRESEDNPSGHPRGGILADDQGFGKTVSMIALLLTNRPEAKEGEKTPWGNLIVAPTSVLNQWASEIKEHIAEQFWPRVLLYHGPKKPKQAKSLTMYDVVVTTYGTLYQEYPGVLEKDRGILFKRKEPGNLFKIDWFRVVLDEAQAIRNFRSETFKAASSLTARRKWSLTGTPIQNTVNDIYSQFMFLGYHVTANYAEWERKFKKPLEDKHCTRAHFGLFRRILAVVLLRRTKHDRIDNQPVLNLPPRNMKTLELSFSKTEEQFYESQEELAVDRIHREAGTTGNDFALALNVILRLRQACGHPALCYSGTLFQDEPLIVGSHPGKAEPTILGKRSAGPSSSEPCTKSQRVSDDASESSDASDESDNSDAVQSEGNSDKRATELQTSTKIKRFMMEFEKIFEDTEDKVLCFSQWTRMLDLVAESVQEQGYEYVRLDGTLSATQRDEQVRLFKTRSECRLFLISLTAGSTGLNLTVANRVFLLDSWWNPAVENQAIDRVHRIGQKKVVEVIRLKIENTIEEHILAIQERKRQIIDGTLDAEGLRTVGRRLTVRDIMGLFQEVAGNVANRAETRQNDVMATRANDVLNIARDIADYEATGPRFRNQTHKADPLMSSTCKQVSCRCSTSSTRSK